MKLILFVLLMLTPSLALASNVSSLAYASTNITTSAYVTFVASSPIVTSRLSLCDTSGVIMKVAFGAANSEVDQFTMPTTACVIIPMGALLPAGTRISLKAISGTASTGYGSVSFLP